MKVYVVWDRLYEKVISAHFTEQSALNRINERNQQRVDERKLPESEEDYCYDFEYDEFELDDYDTRRNPNS